MVKWVSLWVKMLSRFRILRQFSKLQIRMLADGGYKHTVTGSVFKCPHTNILCVLLAFLV